MLRTRPMLRAGKPRRTHRPWRHHATGTRVRGPVQPSRPSCRLGFAKRHAFGSWAVYGWHALLTVFRGPWRRVPTERCGQELAACVVPNNNTGLVCSPRLTSN